MSDVPGQEPDPREQTHLCAHCGKSILNAAWHCPACGAAQPTPTVWPPAPFGGVPSPVAKTTRLLTGKKWLDLTLGFCAGAGVLALGPILMPLISGDVVVPATLVLYGLLYFLSRIPYPVFGRGVGSAIVAFFGGALLIVLGVFLICAANSWHS